MVCEGNQFTNQEMQRNDFPSLQPGPPASLSPSYLRWLDVSRELQKRPDLLAYYDFQRDENNPNMLVNRALTGEKYNGELQNAKWADGRFPGKSGLDFSAKNAGVHINIPGGHKQLTFIAWVYSSRLRNKNNSILFSDGWLQSGKFHWQVMNTGQFEMSVFGQKMGSPYSKNNMPTDSLKRWCMIAGVANTPDQCSVYVNGELFENLETAQIPAITIGPAMIGGWENGGASNQDAIRNFPGRIDELMIFQRVLSADEIKQIYITGRP